MAEPGIEDALEKCLRQHKELRDVIDEIRGYLLQPRPEIGESGCHTWAAALSERMLRLHDQLFRHFRDEEQDGVLDELATRHPGSTSQIDLLQGEHKEILSGIRGLLDDTLIYSEGGEPTDARLRERLSALLDRLGQHETTETELIQSIEYLDLGEGG